MGLGLRSKLLALVKNAYIFREEIMKIAKLRESLALRTGLCALGVALFTLAVLFAIATPAKGFNLLGDRYDPNSINPIQYRFFDNCDSSWVNAFKAGEAGWDAVNVPGYFEEHSWSFDPEIEVRSTFEWANWIGLRDGDDVNGDDLWDGNEVRIWFNTRWNLLTANQKMLVAEHELGHAYGLAHEDDICTLMNTWADQMFACGVNGPGADEIAGVQAIYP